MIIPISIVIPFYQNESGIFVWTQIRKSKDELNGLLEFPGGKVEASESPALAAVREVKEEVEVDIKEGDLLKFKNYSSEVSGKTILLMVFLYEDKEGHFVHSGYVKLNELANMGDRIPPANKEILLDLKDHFC